MQPDNYKPKTTIIPANPNFSCSGHAVVAWVIEDGRVARAVTVGGSGYGRVTLLNHTAHGVIGNDVGELSAPVQRGADE